MIDEILPDALEGERIDRVVAMLDGCSRSVAAELVAAGAVNLDGAVVKQRSARVKTGQRIRFEPTESVEEVIGPDDSVEFTVVHEDDDVIVISKPAGLVVHPGAGRAGGTLANGLLARYPELASVGEPNRPGIVHRLDAETTGLLVVARTPAAHAALVADLARRDVTRVYSAVVADVVADDRGVIDAPIARSTQRRTRMAVIADGREAVTHYEVEARSSDSAATRLQCRLETGRTHQIRVHLAAIGHPVLGDAVYGGATSRDRFTRVALHAATLAFDHPSTGGRAHFDAPTPADMQQLIATLQLS